MTSGEQEDKRRPRDPNPGCTSEADGFLAAVIEHVSDAIVVVDREGKVRFANSSVERLFGRPADEFSGKPFGFPIGSDKPLELDIVRPDGDAKVAEMRVTEAVTRSGTLHVASLRDVSEQVQLRKALQQMSIVDELTGLLNRRGFLTLAEQQCRIAVRSRQELLLLYTDLDGLKLVNDSKGHRAGDQILVDTANILRGTFRGSDIVGRIGGDEFVALAIDAPLGVGAVLVQRLHRNIAAHNEQRGDRPEVSLSMGVTRIDPDSTYPIQDALQEADQLMYEQKAAARHEELSHG